MQKKPKINPPSTIDALNKLINPGKGLYTSSGANYNNDIFGRDSIIASRELLDWDPQIAKEVILTLASLQGVKFDKRTDEEPGRIMHEHKDFDLWKTDKINRFINRVAARAWGSKHSQMTTYFSVDSTPQFIILVAEYARIDPTILGETVIRSDKVEITILDVLTKAANWIIGHTAESGLVEVGRHNPISLIHHNWKDSPTAYIHENGELANVFRPIAYLSVQVLSTDALIAASKIVDKKTATNWLRVAREIRYKTIKKFWMEDKKFFASAIDQDEHGNERILKTLQSDAFWVLNSNLFDDMPESEKKKFIIPLVERMFSSDFITDAGIRCRSLKHLAVNMAGYHGAHAVWPIDTAIAAKGLRRQGFEKLANQLEARIVNSTNMSGSHYEFFYVMPDGKVVLDLKAASRWRAYAEKLPIQMKPEQDIAWTVAAVFSIKMRNSSYTSQDKKSWQSVTEKHILNTIKNIRILNSIKELEEKYPEQPNVYLDIKRGSGEIARGIALQLAKRYFENNNSNSFKLEPFQKRRVN